MNRFTLASICTAGGVFEQGLVNYPIEPIWGVEINPRVADVYRLNYPHSRIVVGDACSVDWSELPRPDFLHASPSCRSFSQLNNKKEAAKDIAVAQAVARAITHFLPEIFTLENVTAYQKSESWFVIKSCLEYLGYQISAKVEKTRFWGVPQKMRNRFIVVATLNRPAIALTAPNRTNHWYECIQDLIPDLEPSELTNTQIKKLTDKTKRAIANGETVLLKRNQIRATTGCAYQSEPYCWTPTATLCTDHKENERSKFADLVTPDGIKKLNVRCLARIQTIPDSYKLPDSIAIGGLVVGDAIPPLFAEQMWRQILEQFDPSKFLKVLVDNSRTVEKSEQRSHKQLTIDDVLDKLFPRKKQSEQRSQSSQNDIIEELTPREVVADTTDLPGEVTPNREADNMDILAHDSELREKLPQIAVVSDLKNLEDIVTQNLVGEHEFYKIGTALGLIKTQKLYKKAGFTGFLSYCRDRFDLGRTYVSDLIKAASVYESVRDVVSCAEITESHCRELGKIKDLETRSQVLEQVAKVGKVTASAIHKTYRELKLEKVNTKNKLDLPKIGDVIRLTTKRNSELKNFNGFWGIVTDSHNFTCDCEVLGEQLKALHPQDFVWIKDADKALAIELLTRLNLIHCHPDINDTVRLLVTAIASREYPLLEEFDECLLNCVEVRISKS